MRLRRLVSWLSPIVVLAACADNSFESTPLKSRIVWSSAPPVLRSANRFLQLTGEVYNSGSGSVVSGHPLLWSSTNTAVVTVNQFGLVTSRGQGTAYIRLAKLPAGGAPPPDDSLLITVDQVAYDAVISPGTVVMGALGSTRQLIPLFVDSSLTAMTTVPSATWTSAGNGATATVSASGLVTAVGVGSSDTAVATIGAYTARAPISVTQVVASIVVNSTGSDTLATTTRTKTYTAVARDSQSNTIPGQSFTWGSATAAVASVDAAGVATALADGVTHIRATIGQIFGQRMLTVRRYAAVFDLAPLTGTITTSGGNTPFAIDARDSVNTLLPATWLSRNTGIATVPATGTNIVATATGNGMTFIIVSAGTRTDSAQLTVSNQDPLNTTAAVNVGDFFFRSVRNNTQDPAIDTIAVGGTVTWTFIGSAGHNVESIGTPDFPSGPIQSSGTLQRVFSATGTYQYQCAIHPAMSGQVVVR